MSLDSAKSWIGSSFCLPPAQEDARRHLEQAEAKGVETSLLVGPQLTRSGQGYFVRWTGSDLAVVELSPRQQAGLELSPSSLVNRLDVRDATSVMPLDAKTTLTEATIDAADALDVFRPLTGKFRYTLNAGQASAQSNYALCAKYFFPKGCAPRFRSLIQFSYIVGPLLPGSGQLNFRFDPIGNDLGRIPRAFVVLLQLLTADDWGRQVNCRRVSNVVAVVVEPSGSLGPAAPPENQGLKTESIIVSSTSDTQRIAHEWQRVEATLQTAKLWTEPIRMLVEALRGNARLSCKPDGSVHLDVGRPRLPKLLELAAAVSPDDLRRVAELLTFSGVGILVGHLHDRCRLQQELRTTRVLFGLPDPPGEALQAAAGRVADVLFMTKRPLEVLRELSRAAPDKLRPLRSEEQLASVCMADAEALAFLDHMARQVESVAVELYRQLKPACDMFLQVCPPEPTTEFGEDDERYLRNVLQGLYVVLHVARTRWIAQWTRERLAPVTAVAGELLECSLADSLLLHSLLRRYPRLLAEPVADESTGEAAERVQASVDCFESIAGVLDVLRGQWEHLPAPKRSWATGNLEKSREHLKHTVFAIRNLRGLYVQSQAFATPEPRPSPRRSCLVPRPHAAHLQVHEQWLQSATQAPALTNRAKFASRTTNSPLGTAAQTTIVLHHAGGAACIGEYGLIPLTEMMPADSRLLLTAARLANECSCLLHMWEVACAECQLGDRLAELKRRGMMPVTLVTHWADGRPVFGHFVFPEEQVAGLFDPREVVRLTPDILEAYAEQNIELFKPSRLVSLIWIAPEESDEPWLDDDAE